MNGIKSLLLLKIIVTLRANLALKKQNFAESKIALFAEACAHAAKAQQLNVVKMLT